MLSRLSYRTSRLSLPADRRRLLGYGAAGGAALTLASCSGGGSDSPEAPAASIGGTPAPAQVKRGGTLRLANTQDPVSLNPDTDGTGPGFTHLGHVFQRLYRERMVFPPDANQPGVLQIEPELAATLPEVTPDATQFVVTLRNGVRFQDIAPVSGRMVTSDDVVKSYDRFLAQPKNAQAGQYKNVKRIEAVDGQRVRFTLKTPDVTFTTLLGHYSAGFTIIPPGVDPEKQWIGTGPFTINLSSGDYAPQSLFRYRANPNYWEKGLDDKPLPYVDTVEWSYIPDQNQRIAQFEAGNIDTVGVPFELVPVYKSNNRYKQGRPVILLFQTFGWWHPSAQKENRAPFNDVRVRRAISMAINRDDLATVQYGGSDQVIWCTSVPPGLPPYSLDSRAEGQRLGDAAQWLKYDPNRAKQLLTEAGVSAGQVNMALNYTNSPLSSYGPRFTSAAEAIAKMLEAVGIKVSLNPTPYQQYITDIFNSDKYSGMVFAGSDSYLWW